MSARSFAERLLQRVMGRGVIVALRVLKPQDRLPDVEKRVGKLGTISEKPLPRLVEKPGEGQAWEQRSEEHTSELQSQR